MSLPQRAPYDPRAARALKHAPVRADHEVCSRCRNSDAPYETPVVVAGERRWVFLCGLCTDEVHGLLPALHERVAAGGRSA